MVNLITTNSYFNLFNQLIKSLKERGNSIDTQNIVFCEEKVSLMIERMLCYEMGGSFNTDVYSFGNFLRVKKPNINALSKEGSAMVVKKVLSSANLKCFKASRATLAPTLSELIMQLKSAKITPKHLTQAIDGCEGVLKNKLIDLAEVFSQYEQFISERGLEDQSSSLSFLTEVINQSEEVKRSDVYIVGFNGFTAQIKSAISALFDNAKSVTAILTMGDNPLVFVNETASFIENLAKQKSLPLLKKTVDSEYTKEGKYLVDTLFDLNKKRSDVERQTKTIYCGQPLSIRKEAERVAEIIKSAVMNGECRYRDVTVAIPDANLYGDYIKDAFAKLKVPYFLDERKKIDTNPLVTLICAYIDVYRKNFERNALCRFFKNPLFESDKGLTDAFENYLFKYNVNYQRIKEPFTLNKDNKDDLEVLEAFRLRVVSVFAEFDVRKMVNQLDVENKINDFSLKLKELGQVEESAINEQVYQAVTSILDQMQVLLSGVKLSTVEYKNVFLSGIGALELSIIPQYNDAVFVGAYKETALAKAKYLFMMGLTSDVPNAKADVALITDDEIDRLEQIKVLIEPKIRVVNHRVRENIALALSAYEQKLYLTCPLVALDGSKNAKSEVLEHVEQAFDCLSLPEEIEYLTYEQGLENFAKECGLFIERQSDFISASSFYHAVDKQSLDKLLDEANKEVQIKLNVDNPEIIGQNISPTSIEDYYKCPYRAFLSHKIRLKSREQGKVEAFSVGTLIHDIFSNYTSRLTEVFDRQSSDKVVEEICAQLLVGDEYQRYMLDKVTKSTIERVKRESKDYCYKTYLYMNDSSFKVKHQEVAFGDGKKIPAIELLNGNVKIKGKIDRVDESDNYFRVLDYKTGKADIADKNLYTGVKLQLYLYAAAVQKTCQEKQLAGLYYLPIKDKYEILENKDHALAIGKTLDDEVALSEQDKNVKENRTSVFLPLIYNGKSVSNSLKSDALNGYVEYAIKMSEQGAEQMKQGVIVASATQGTCDYCEYKGLCQAVKAYERKVEKVDEDTIFVAVKGGEQDAEINR